MLGILPFLIQWIALSQLGSQHPYFQHVQQQSVHIPKSHWTLLNEFKQLPEEEVDHFLPQVCNMVLDRESLRDDDLYNYFESVLEQKCAECFSFGTRVCGVLKATQPAPSESLFKSIYSLTSPSSAQTIRSEERLRAFQERIEHATMYGLHLSPEHSEMRSAYYRDYQFMLDTLARLGIELKSYPVALRNLHLRHALSQCNALLFFRMASRGSISTADTSLQDFASFHDLSAHNIATLLPDAAQYSLHLPLHKPGDNVCRILRFVESECEVLPSRERCPYVVVVEVLEQPYSTKSNMIYSHGRVPAVSLAHDNMGHSEVLYNGQSQLLPNGRAPRQHKHDAVEVSQSVLADPYSLTQRRAKSYAMPRATRGNLLSNNLSNHKSRSSDASGGYSRTRRYRSFSNSNNGNRFIDSNNNNANFDRAEYEKNIYTTDPVNEGQGEEALTELEQAYDLYDEVNSYSTHDGSTDEQIQSALNAINQGVESSNPEATITSNENSELLARPHAEVKDDVGSTDKEEEETCLLDANHQFDLSSRAKQLQFDNIRGGSVPSASLPSGDNDPARKSHIYPRIPIRRRPSVRSSRQQTSHIQPSAAGVSPVEDSKKAEQTHRGTGSPAPPSLPARPLATVTSNHVVSPSLTVSGNAATSTAKAVTAVTPTLPTTATVISTAPPFTPFGVSWSERRASLQAKSPFGALPGWDARSFIVKSGDDLRKEVLAMQVMEFCQNVFEMEGLDIYLRPYQILSTGAQAGLVEFLQGAESIDKIKKTLQAQQQQGLSSATTRTSTSTSTPGATPATAAATLPTLKQYFELQFGESYSFFYAKAVKNFVKSLVGYSLLTYVVQVKDRHNANILFDEEGHVVHIDFGFILGDSPGFNINFESAPFKLTAEYIEILGGVQSEDFKQFQDLFLKGFLALQKHVDGIASIVQPFYGDKRKAAADGVRSRLLFPQSQSDILSLIGDSLDNWRTKQYDWYQERTNNIQL